MEDAGKFYGHLVNIPAIWYILWPFSIRILWSFGIGYGNLVYVFLVIWYIFPVLVCCAKNNLVTLISLNQFCSLGSRL
jgi:hypothetical protein